LERTGKTVGMTTTGGIVSDGHLIANRQGARAEERLRVLEGTTALFFTGADQLRITSQIGDTPILRKIEELFASGGVVAGTSAAAPSMFWMDPR
jgi:cyanophycinase-like exopeptidase